MRNIHFSNKTKAKIQRQLIWYSHYRSASYARTLSRNLSRDIRALALMPTIGLQAYEIDGRQYHKFPSHKKSTIYYWFSETDIYIDNVVFYYENA